MWISMSDSGWYTVYYCPKCRRQMTWHTIRNSIFKCDMCGLLMRYDGNRLSLDLKGR